MKIVFIMLIYSIGAPILGGLLSGIDRKITARMQGRKGPPVLQPFFDLLKLMEKETIVTRRSQNFYILFFLIFAVVSGGLFFCGGNVLLTVFSLTLAGVFFILGGFKCSSPYSFIGSQRELIQMTAYEPAVLMSAIGYYMITKSFNAADIAAYHKPLIVYLPGVFIGLVYVLTVKFRKSPFDLSTSHHGHQELVKGITTEFSGRALAMIEAAHWYENILILGFVYLFFASNPVLGLIITAAVYFLEILIDNTFARFKWQAVLGSCWLVTLIFGLSNIIILSVLQKRF